MAIEKTRISDDDIKYGGRRDSKTCPVARGLSMNYDHVQVGTKEVGLRRSTAPGNNTWLRFKTDAALEKWINDHDHMKPVEEIVVALDFDEWTASIAEPQTDDISIAYVSDEVIIDGSN